MVVFFVVALALLYGAGGLYYLGLRRQGLLPVRTAQERTETRARVRHALPWVALEGMVPLIGLALLVIIALNVRGREGLLWGVLPIGAAAIVTVLAHVEARLRMKRPLPGGLDARTVRVIAAVFAGILTAMWVVALITDRMAGS